MAPKPSFFANGNRKHDLLTALLLSFLFTLSYGLLTPLEIILSNQKEFLISFWTIAGKILLPVAAVFCAVLVVLAISALIGHRAFRVVSSLLLGLTLAWYCRRPKWQNGIQVITKQLYFGICSLIPTIRGRALSFQTILPDYYNIVFCI